MNVHSLETFRWCERAMVDETTQPRRNVRTELVFQTDANDTCLLSNAQKRTYGSSKAIRIYQVYATCPKSSADTFDDPQVCSPI